MTKSLYEKYTALATAGERANFCDKLTNAQLASLKAYSDAMVERAGEQVRQGELTKRQFYHEVAGRTAYVDEAKRRGVDPMYLVQELLGPLDGTAPGTRAALDDPTENPTVVEFRKKLRGQQ